MPLRKDIHKVMVLGSGPIVIGQAAEFDYAGTQACRALREEGLEVVLVNSNPATIMTDKAMADKVYIEPMTVEAVQEIIKKEHPDSLLPNLGGQTGLNLAMELCENGFLDKMGVKLLGANPTTIAKAEVGAAFGPAIMLSLFWKRFNFKGAVAGIITGAAVDILWYAFLTSTGIYELLPGFVLGLIAAVVVTLCTNEPSKEVYELFDKAEKFDE